MICLDIYDEESKCYTPYNFLDFCGFECHYNDITGMYDVNGFVNGAVNIASFDDEEFAVAVTRSLFTLKAIAEFNHQPEARFINVDMIVEELKEMEEDDEVLITNETEEKIEEIAYCNVAYKFICIFIGFVIGVMIGVFL